MQPKERTRGFSFKGPAGTLLSSELILNKKLDANGDCRGQAHHVNK
jgi:hypothetical protein